MSAFKPWPGLAAHLSEDMKARPWLYDQPHESGPAGRPGPTVAGGPIAVKLGVAIGAARRREHLRMATDRGALALAQGLIDKDAAEAIEAAIRARGAVLDQRREWWNRVSPPRVFNRVVDRRPRIEHRARLAASGPMPPDLAMKFTVAELAVMKIVADEVFQCGTCRITKKELGDRARASETTVHNATRKADRLGLVTIKHRPVPGRKSLPNLIMVVDPEWRLWIARPKYRAIREDQERRAIEPQSPLGANPRTPQTATYTKTVDGVWTDTEEEGRRDDLGRRSRPPDTPARVEA